MLTECFHRQSRNAAVVCFRFYKIIFYFYTRNCHACTVLQVHAFTSINVHTLLYIIVGAHFIENGYNGYRFVISLVTRFHCSSESPRFKTFQGLNVLLLVCVGGFSLNCQELFLMQT